MKDQLPGTTDTPTRDAGAVADAVTSLEVMLTAAEAYPALERLFLGAEREILAGFRLFDLRTRLRSDEAKKIGEDWFDLVVDTLNRGVDIHFVISDFDPIGAAELHQRTWHTRRMMEAANEVATGDGRLTAVMDMHGARAGWLPRLMFYPIVRKRLVQLIGKINDMKPGKRKRFLQEAFRLRDVVDLNGEKVTMRACLPKLFPTTHHQKLAVFDGEILNIGGLDLNERRWDTPAHDRSAASTWYDVQVTVEGPVVEAARAHLKSFVATVADEAPPAPARPGFLRTLSVSRGDTWGYLSPRPEIREIEEAHLRLTGQSRRLIYLETQFLRHMRLARALAKRAKDCPELRLILILPAAPEGAAFDSDPGSDVRYGEYVQARCVRVLRQAFGEERLIIASPVEPRASDSDGRDTLHGSPLIYVHAKVSVFDEEAAIVSSANLNGRSMLWDTEAGVELRRDAHVRAVRDRTMTHWISDTPVDAPDRIFAHWKQRIDTDTEVDPKERGGFLVHYRVAPARRIGIPLPGVPEEIV